MVAYQSKHIPVEGGELHYGIWGKRGPLILASHGLTASHIGFQALADELGNSYRLVAPDHRGRGRSREIDGPWGMAAHANDLLAVLDDMGAPQADVLVGHSMGGFVAAVTGQMAPGRVASILFVDGGLPALDKLPEGVSPEGLVHAVIGPAMQRLDRRFESLESYLDFWKQHPAFADDWSPYIEQYAEYDLIGESPDLRSSAVKEAIVADVQTQLMSDLVPQALASLRMPLAFLSAPRGIMNAEPLYAPEILQQWDAQTPNASLRSAKDVNHYSIVLSQRGARQIKFEIQALLDEPG